MAAVVRPRLPRAVIALGVPSAVLASLALVLVVAQRDRIRYELPQLPAMDAEQVQKVTIRRPDAAIELRRMEAGWTVGQSGNQADASLVLEAITAVGQLRLTDLVSVGDLLGRYELDEASRTEVTLHSEAGATRTVWIGRQAVTLAHTFVTLPEDGRVFHAAGSLRDLFGRAEADYRDTLVLRFDTGAVSSITVHSGGTVSQLTGSAEGWRGPHGALWPGTGVAEAIAQAGGLHAIRYAEGPPTGEPLFSVEFHARDAVTHTLSLFPEVDNSFPATSSFREDAFLLFTWVGDALVAAFQP